VFCLDKIAGATAKRDYEKLGVFYLGRQYDLAGQKAQPDRTHSRGGGGVAAVPRALAGNRRVFLNPVPEAIVMGVERTAPTLVPSFQVQTRRSDDSNPWPVTEEQS